MITEETDYPVDGLTWGEHSVEELKAEIIRLHKRYRHDMNEAAGMIKKLQAELDSLRGRN